MKIKFFSLSLLTLVFLLQPCLGQKPPDYILIEFEGVSIDKYISGVVFSIEEFNYDIEEHKPVSKFRINKCEYLSIIDVIKENFDIKKLDSTSLSPFQFWIVRNNKRELYGTSTLQSTERLFEMISNEIQKRKKRALVKSTFDETLSFINSIPQK